jgi:F-type H+-transporting ATPase subunit alpha
VAVEDIEKWETEFHAYMDAQGREVLKAIRETKELTEDTENQLKELLKNFNESRPAKA